MEKVLNSTRQVVSSQQRNEFSVLNSLSDDIFFRLCDFCVEILVSQPQDIANRLATLAGDTGMSLNSTKNSMKALMAFFRAVSKNSLSPQLLESDLLELGLSNEKTSYVVQQWTSNFVKICTSVLNQTFTVNRLVDTEWRFGVTAANSDMERVGSTFLQLKMVIDKSSNETEDVTVDLSLPQFYDFLHKMEKAKASLDAMT